MDLEKQANVPVIDGGNPTIGGLVLLLTLNGFLAFHFQNQGLAIYLTQRMKLTSCGMFLKALELA